MNPEKRTGENGINHLMRKIPWKTCSYHRDSRETESRRASSSYSFPKRHKIGWLYMGVDDRVNQTRYQWPGSPKVDESIVFQGLLYPDGTPYSEDEIKLLLNEAGKS